MLIISNYIGLKFNRLLVQAEASPLNGNSRVNCLCECGTEKEFYLTRVVRGIVKSCGCYKAEYLIKSRTTHGLTGNILYTMWRNILSRCTNPKDIAYRYYGGRGITVCPEWLSNPQLFIDWALANGYQRGLQIDRRENDGNYEPSNCRFVTPQINANNKRSPQKIF